jgi:hypothetical protein
MRQNGTKFDRDQKVELKKNIPSFLAKLIINWKSLPGRNALAYYKKFKLWTIFLLILSPGANLKNIFVRI